MQKRIWIGLALLAALVIVAVGTTGNVGFDVFGLKWTMKTAYALLGAGAVGVVAGAMVRP